MTSDDKVTYFAETDSRNKRIKFGIKAKDRTRHMYVIGKTGMGKSTLLENMAVQDIQSGEGLCFIDPHGKTAELLLNYVPEHRIKDVLYFAPFDTEHPVSFNVMEDVGYDKRHLVVSGLMSTFKKIWVDAWSARMEYILGNTLLALLEYPGATLLGVNKMLSDKVFRKKVVDNISDPAVKSFWVDEFAKYTEKFAAEATPAIQNKIGQFTNNPLIRNIIGQPKSSFDIRKMMDERKIIIVNLSKGRVGESNANLLGAMFITKIYLAAMSRADVSEKTLKTLPNFYLFVDEFQSFANESFADILSEARKYKLNLTIAHQYIEQMTDEVRAAVFGNVGTMIVFRVGAYDAEVLEKEFAPQFEAEDIVNLGQYQLYLRLMIDGVGSQPFSGRNLPPIAEPAVSYKDQAVESSRAQFGQPRSLVEEQVRKQTMSEELNAPAKPKEGTPNASAPKSAQQPHHQNHPPQSPAQAPRPVTDVPRKDQNPHHVQNHDRKPVHEHKERPTPPSDEADGFQGLEALKNLHTARPPKNDVSVRTGNTPKPEKKGVTPESREDLKKALAALIGNSPEKTKTAVESKPEPKKEETSPAKDSKAESQSEQKKQQTEEPKSERREVPEEVLKRILEV